MTVDRKYFASSVLRRAELYLSVQHKTQTIHTEGWKKLNLLQEAAPAVLVMADIPLMLKIDE